MVPGPSIRTFERLIGYSTRLAPSTSCLSGNLCRGRELHPFFWILGFRVLLVFLQVLLSSYAYTLSTNSSNFSPNLPAFNAPLKLSILSVWEKLVGVSKPFTWTLNLVTSKLVPFVVRDFVAALILHRLHFFRLFGRSGRISTSITLI